jgi:gamma-glutamyltranspeptidase / glutathione hydrolase
MQTWNSRRSPVIGTKNGMCASSQPLATAVGCRIIERGGTAADAAIAMAAVLNVVEPCSTGIGGDAFCLYYEASTKKVHSIQGNGKSGAAFNLAAVNAAGFGVGPGQQPIDFMHGLCITVPGSASLWDELVKTHGRFSLAENLQPAIDLAEQGFPVAPQTAAQWEAGGLQGAEADRVLRPGGRSPYAGELFANPDLAATFRAIATQGVEAGFYGGRIADAIVQACAEFGGVLTKEDLAQHKVERDEPISVVYKGVRIYETPAPTHGLAALLSLSMLEQIDKQSGDRELAEGVVAGAPLNFRSPKVPARSSAEEAHRAIECTRLGYADALQYLTDPRFSLGELGSSDEVVAALLRPENVAKRAALVDASRSIEVQPSDMAAFAHSETVYFCCVDKEGNACSMVNSNYEGFGSGIVPKGCGFTLQNRGHNFSLVPGHHNVAEPSKKPYHTIISSIATFEADGSLFATLGNMGGFMQPMGHVQLYRNLIDFKMNPQAALDAPRWYLDGAGVTQNAADMRHSKILLEDGYGGPEDGGSAERTATAQALTDLGHRVVPAPVAGGGRELFGKAQLIVRDPSSGVLWAGSEPRADGCAMMAL